MTKNVETEVELPVSKFNKQQILQSRRYFEQRDLLEALLKDGEQYSHGGIKILIDEFLKGRVK